LPALAYAIVPAYNVPALSGQVGHSHQLYMRTACAASFADACSLSRSQLETLVFDLQTIADILYGRIAKWNHANISALNPTLQGLLPDANISVVVSFESSLENLLMTTALQHGVANWAVHLPPHRELISLAPILTSWRACSLARDVRWRIR
jgi:hypothetical protein